MMFHDFSFVLRQIYENHKNNNNKTKNNNTKNNAKKNTNLKKEQKKRKDAFFMLVWRERWSA